MCGCGGGEKERGREGEGKKERKHTHVEVRGQLCRVAASTLTWVTRIRLVSQGSHRKHLCLWAISLTQKLKFFNSQKTFQDEVPSYLSIISYHTPKYTHIWYSHSTPLLGVWRHPWDTNPFDGLESHSLPPYKQTITNLLRPSVFTPKPLPSLQRSQFFTLSFPPSPMLFYNYNSCVSSATGVWCIVSFNPHDNPIMTNYR